MPLPHQDFVPVERLGTRPRDVVGSDGRGQYTDHTYVRKRCLAKRPIVLMDALLGGDVVASPNATTSRLEPVRVRAGSSASLVDPSSLVDRWSVEP